VLKADVWINMFAVRMIPRTEINNIKIIIDQC
jgi:hypothetical protein